MLVLDLDAQSDATRTLGTSDVADDQLDIFDLLCAGEQGTEPTTPVRQGPGRPATGKGWYEPFSTKISIPLRDRLDAEVARVRGTDEELTTVSVLEAALTNWLDAREREGSS